jgi:hypothetical protein
MTLSSAVRLRPSYTPGIHDGFATRAFTFELGHPDRRDRGVRRVGGDRDPRAAVLLTGARAQAPARVGRPRSGALRRVGAARERRGCRARAAGLAGRPLVGAPGAAEHAGGCPSGRCRRCSRRGASHASGIGPAHPARGEPRGYPGSLRASRLWSSRRGWPSDRRKSRTWSSRSGRPGNSQPGRALARGARQLIPGRGWGHHRSRDSRGGYRSYSPGARRGRSPCNLTAGCGGRHVASRSAGHPWRSGCGHGR